MLVAPAVLLAAVVGVSLLTASPGEGRRSSPAPSSSAGSVAQVNPTPSSSSDAVARTSPLPRLESLDCIGGGNRVAAGRAVVGREARVRVRITLPEGWCLRRSMLNHWSAESADDDATSVIGFTVKDGPLPCVDRAVLSDFKIPEFAEVMFSGFAGERIEFAPGSACSPSAVLDALGAPGGRDPNTHLTLWLLDVEGQRLAMYATTTPAVTGRPANTRRQDELRQLIESAWVSGDPWPYPEEPVPPEPGELAPGYYVAVVDSDPALDGCCPQGSFGFTFRVPSASWVSGDREPGWQDGSISRGMVGSPDGAIIRWGNPERIYADPCAGTLGPPIGESVGDLAAAMATIPGVRVSGPTEVPLRWSTAQHVVLTIPDGLPCDPQAFGLWWDERTGPRTVTAPGSRIEVWIFNPNDRSVFGRVVIEAETYPGVSPEVEREIAQIVASVDHGG